MNHNFPDNISANKEALQKMHPDGNSPNGSLLNTFATKTAHLLDLVEQLRLEMLPTIRKLPGLMANLNRNFTLEKERQETMASIKDFLSSAELPEKDGKRKGVNIQEFKLLLDFINDAIERAIEETGKLSGAIITIKEVHGLLQSDLHVFNDPIENFERPLMRLTEIHESFLTSKDGKDAFKRFIEGAGLAVERSIDALTMERSMRLLSKWTMDDVRFG